MARYIDCDKCYHGRVCSHRHQYHDMIVECNHHIPTTDVAEVKHGEWELHGGDDDMELYGFCTNCGRGELTEDDIERLKPKFCPYCGAKMDGKDGDGE